MSRNPFIYEDAVPPDRFFDRKEEVEFFEMQLKSGKRKFLIAIVGPLKFGKTSLMLKYIEIVRRYSDIIPIYIDMNFCEKPIKFLASELSRIFRTESFIRWYVESKEEGLSTFFSRISDFLESRGKWLFLFIDEFHLLPKGVKSEGFLQEFSDTDVFRFFRGFAERRRISYIVCGSSVEEFLEALDVWGGRFEIVYLGPFKKDDAVNMLKNLFVDAGFEVDEILISELAEAAGYHPFYMQYMGSVIYSLGKPNRRTVSEAKRRLWEFLRPTFSAYMERLLETGEELLMVFLKVLRGEEISLRELKALNRLYRMGFIRPKNSSYEPVDPLFTRFVEANVSTGKVSEVVVVGHWAERIVGNYLLRKGYMPFYSHDSKGAFDIYVRVKKRDVGIQVKYSSSGEVLLTNEEAKRIKEAADETGWIPILALVTDRIDFFPWPREGKYKKGEGLEDIEAACDLVFLM